MTKVNINNLAVVQQNNSSLSGIIKQMIGTEFCQLVKRVANFLPIICTRYFGTCIFIKMTYVCIV